MAELEAKRAADRLAAEQAQADRLRVLQLEASESGVVNSANRYGQVTSPDAYGAGTPATAGEQTPESPEEQTGQQAA